MIRKHQAISSRRAAAGAAAAVNVVVVIVRDRQRAVGILGREYEYASSVKPGCDDDLDVTTPLTVLRGVFSSTEEEEEVEECGGGGSKGREKNTLNITF
jgi:hypothetical protein